MVPGWDTVTVGSIANRGAGIGSRGMAWLKDPNQQPQQREPALRIDGGSGTGGAHDEALVPTPCPHPPTADRFRVTSSRHQTFHCVRRAEAAFLTHCLDWCGCIISPKWRHAGMRMESGTRLISSRAPVPSQTENVVEAMRGMILSLLTFFSIYYIYTAP